MRQSGRIVLIVSLVVAAVGSSYAGGLQFAATLSNAQANPAPAPGLITDSNIVVQFDAGFTRVDVRLAVEGGDRVLAAHFHCNGPGQNGPVALGLFQPGPLAFDGMVAEGTLTNDNFTGADCVPLIGRPVRNLVSLALAMRAGLIYINVHTSDNPGGEVRGQLLEVRNDANRGDGDDDDDDDQHGHHLFEALQIEMDAARRDVGRH